MKIIIELPDEIGEMFSDLAGALQTIARVVTVKVEEETAKTAPLKEMATLEEARSKLAELSRNGKRNQVESLIQAFGAKKLTEVPQEKLPDLMAKAEAMA